MKSLLGLAFMLALTGSACGGSTLWKAGAARIQITPKHSVWMTGFAARTNSSTGTLQELYAKAMALEDASGQRTVLVTTDLLGFPSGVAHNIAERTRTQQGVSRDRLMLNSSHTHGAPALEHPNRMIYGAR